MALRHLVFGAAWAAGSASAASVTCASNLPLSCQNTTAVSNTCCFNYPGGQLLQTQFWDTNPSTGPSNSWTVHGLWPDNCDGTFQQNCDSSRAYTNISAILAKSAPSTLSFMQTYWKDISGNDESFWEHEFGKHATCISTLDPDCYTNYQPTQEVGDFFTRTVSLFQSLPSYDWLAAAGIVPSKTATYTLAAIQAALTAHHGHNVVINCDNGELNELWYQFNVRGSVQTGTFTPVDPVGSGSTCPKTGIKYLPKSASSTKSSGGGGSTPPPGGVLSGAWYRAGGTPATYTATPNGSTFTLSSSKGKCAILSDSSLSCSSSVSTASSFGYDGTHLTYQGSAKFYAAATPSGQDQGTVFASSHAVSVAIAWNAQ
ncbi:ribonuclease t2 family domain-containing protein [Trichoderma breve]|uniref:Ribonuclease T2-like n=1 Tax=Trichoderma breve TaxID=2034170 RepID=A0A9W9E2N7_9HYPO|nr:ribonuclease t2 family domain-containing protein [Trichoderma breve]KAJ4854212.1 ribonuclease t2 family domain-containing protein [Trichoderma breve]